MSAQSIDEPTCDWKPQTDEPCSQSVHYEAFEFSLLDGDVHVRNESHLDPSHHEYRVTVVDGDPAACECPADAADDGPCKHRVAVAIRPQILDIAVKMQAVTDGGLVTDDDHPADQSRDLNATQCDCDELGDFPAGSAFGLVAETSLSRSVDVLISSPPRVFIPLRGVRGADETPRELPMATRQIYRTSLTRTYRPTTRPVPNAMASENE